MLLQGDCAEVLKTLPDNSVDSLVTDPPAGIAFMGKDWDKDKGGRKEWCAWMEGIMREALRVMKPGAHGLVWALPRTSHWTATALEDAGFEVRDCITHLFGSGFPKSLDISKAIDKAAGAEREVVGKDMTKWRDASNYSGGKYSEMRQSDYETKCTITAPATEAAKQWQGFGTALKPAAEFWYLVRKPLSEKTVAANVLKWGTGGLNIDGSRIGFEATDDARRTRHGGFDGSTVYRTGERKDYQAPAQGRFPANLVLSHSPYCEDIQCDIECAVSMLDAQSLAGGMHSAGKARKGGAKNGDNSSLLGIGAHAGNGTRLGDSGGASRFFYCAKISASERNAGLDKFNCAEIDSSAWNVADTEAGVLLLRAILESMPSLSIAESGARITVTSPKDILFTTRTRISQITESRILSWLMPSHTNDRTPVANCETEHGGSDAAFAKSLSELMSRIGTLPGKDGSLLVDAVPVIFQSLQKISNAEEWKPLVSSHPTVKSSKLMRYLCKLVTPPGGTVLDPFMGSGSTGLAAKSEGFGFVGIEREQEYFEIAKARIG